MKKTTRLAAWLLGALLSSLPGTSFAQSKSAYNFKNVDWTKMVEVFHSALAKGKNYPDESELLALGITKADLAFIKSHVKCRETIADGKQLLPDTYQGRKMWMNTPMGSGSGGDAGYPSNQFHSDVFSLWNYVSLWGSWNHAIVQTPGSWVDAAHKNGCDMMSGTVFFDRSGDVGYTQWMNMVRAVNDRSSVGFNGFKYVKPLIHMMRYFGMDGININWEWSTPVSAANFHKALYKYAHSIGFNNFHLGLYTTNSFLTDDNCEYLYSQKDGQVADAMLNYGGETGMNSSAQAANEANSTLGTKGLWQGFWIVGMDHSWTALDNGEGKKVNLCLWGEHKDSRFWSYNSGSNAYVAQENYQTLLERAFTGGSRNPLIKHEIRNYGNKMEWSGSTPPLNTFCGFSRWIPERSTIKGKFPFSTNFILGNGDRYNYYGKRTAGAWYNMGAQDVVPTYRWLVINAGQAVTANATVSNAISVKYTHNDAFTGGSCIQLTGDASKATDIVLYNTEIVPNDNKTYALVAIKGAGERQEGEVKSNLSLILYVNGAWRTYAVPNNKGKSWQEHRIALDLGPNDKVEKVGLRVQGGTTGYDMYVGKLELNDGKTTTPSAVQNLVVEKVAETPSLMDVKLHWDVNHPANSYGLVYNDDANIDHFEILVKDGQDGKVFEIGRTSQWASLVGNVDVSKMTAPMFGVAAVSTDLKTTTTPVWFAVAKNPNAVETNPFGTYGESSANKNAEGYATALKCRAVESFKTTGAVQNVNYTLKYADFKAESEKNGGNQYHKVTDQVLKVKQGSTIDFYLKGFDGNVVASSNDDLRYCFVGGWMDFDGSGTFNHGKGVKEQPFWISKVYQNNENGEENFETDATTNDGTDPLGERVFRAGSLRGGNKCLVKEDGYHGKITIPADAHLGKSRLRIVYSDAWFQGTFGPVGLTTKGYTLDIDVIIEGENVNNQRNFGDTHDQGEAADWTIVTDIADAAKVEGQVPSACVQDGAIHFNNTMRAILYTVDGTMVKVFNRPSVVSNSHLAKGVYLLKLINGKNEKTIKVML